MKERSRRKQIKRVLTTRSRLFFGLLDEEYKLYHKLFLERRGEERKVYTEGYLMSTGKLIQTVNL